jgi:uncharacterized protein DUF4410
MRMIRRACFAFCLVTMAAQVATAQGNAGNVVTGEAKVTIISSYSGSATLPKPEKILIQDFTPVGDIATDESAAARLHRHISLRHGSDEDSTPEVLTQRVQDSFSKTLIKELAKENIPSEKESHTASTAAATVLIVEGEFIAINEGNKSKRVMIGFGRGASDVKTHVTVSSFTKGKKTVALEFDVNSASGKKPGAVAAMGGASLAVGAAAGDVGDKKGTVQADASRMAQAVAKQIKQFMISQKWIPPASRK